MLIMTISKDQKKLSPQFEIAVAAAREAAKKAGYRGKVGVTVITEAGEVRLIVEV